MRVLCVCVYVCGLSVCVRERVCESLECACKRSPSKLGYCHRFAPQAGLRASYICKLPSRLHNRWPAMTESPATKPANGEACQHVKNGLKPERNGWAKSLHRCHEPQPEHHGQPEEEEVRPGMGLGEERLVNTRTMLSALSLFQPPASLLGCAVITS